MDINKFLYEYGYTKEFNLAVCDEVSAFPEIFLFCSLAQKRGWFFVHNKHRDRWNSPDILFIADVILYRLKGIGTDDVLDLAGIDGGDVGVYSEGDQKIGQYRVTLVKLLGSRDTLLSQSDEARFIDAYIFARLEYSDCAADARL